MASVGFRNLSRSIDRINERVGDWVSWFATFLVFLICIDVLMRYFFNTTKTWIIELEWHFFGILFLLGAAHTLLEDKHVRVDLFYSRFSKRQRQWVDLIGHLVFLIPWCAVVIWTSYDYAMNSFSFREGSPNPGGLPARYVIKFVICIGFVLLLLQGISQIIKVLIARSEHHILSGE